MRTSAVKKNIRIISFAATACLLSVFCMLMFQSCNKSGVAEEGAPKATTLIVSFENTVDSLPLLLDTLIYENASSDFYMISDLQYFISDIKLHRNDGFVYNSLNDNGIHYVDARIPASRQWVINSSVPSGTFDSISFTFGISAVKNYSYRFPNPPERDMNWPDILGGGYHYMKMNLMWTKSGLSKTFPFNFHLGIGQIYRDNFIDPDSIERYVQNYFFVKLPASSFSIGTGETRNIIITMNINRWFTGNNDFDFAKYPNMMMQNQGAIHNACLNGRNAFTVRFTSGGKK
jgi:hypothetical protein